MWSKPKEIAGSSMNGYEISVGGGGKLSAESALKSWLNSSAHRDVIENKNTWANREWAGFGCSIKDGYGHCVFLA
jgi:hypothetical protein